MANPDYEWRVMHEKRITKPRKDENPKGKLQLMK